MVHAPLRPAVGARPRDGLFRRLQRQPPARIVEATAQPTILLAYASATNAAYANEPSASRT